MDRFLIVDVGSTTTKATFFERRGEWRYARREAPTTVERPYENVFVGLLAAVRDLEASTGVRLLDRERPVVPLYLTSSAGGGLAMVVTGLVARLTSRSAERAALGAGANLLDTIAVDDGRGAYGKIEALRDLRPDMVLFAGGFDGEALSGPVFLAELLRLANLRPKLSEEAALPVVYAGNVNAADLVRRTLGEGYLFHPVPNIRPEGDRENLEPARKAIHEIFMDHVMSHAPGYSRLLDLVSAPVLPTPAAFAAILSLASERIEGRILAVDVGGATTDVFTAEEGEVFRTVSANLGMSYSIRNVVETAGVEAVAELLDPPLGEREIWNRVGEKHVHPTRLAPTATDLRMEWALAATALRHAVAEHLAVRSGAPISRGEEELALRAIGRAAGRGSPVRERPPGLSGYDLVIGSGGIFSHSPRSAAARMLLAGLLPVGVIALAVDRAFLLPHLGALAAEDPGLAAELFFDLALVPLGTVVAAARPRRGPARVSVSGTTEEGRTVAGTAEGELRVLPLDPGEAAALTARPGGRIRATGGTEGLLLDARGRPPSPTALRFTDGEPSPPPPRKGFPPPPPLSTGAVRLRRELATAGDVLVAEGDSVTSDTEIARCTRTFLRPFFLPAADVLGVSAEELREHLEKGPGDEISAGEVLARRRAGLLRDLRYCSPVDGTIEGILPDGTVVVREREEQARELVAVEVAEEMGLRPGRLAPYLRVAVGDEVEKGQALARRLDHRGLRISRSPFRGRVERIDAEFGIVLVAPLREELVVRARLPGRVVSVTSRGAVVEGAGTRIRGTWGHGGEASGPLAFDRIETGSVAALPRAREEDLRLAGERGAAGLVAPALDLEAVLETNPAFPVVLTEGFGKREMPREVARTLSAHDGRPTLIDGTTVLRVGVRRPSVILVKSPNAPLGCGPHSPPRPGRRPPRS